MPLELLDKTVDYAIVHNRDAIEKAIKEALQNSRLTGYGFVVIKRESRGGKFNIKSALWPELDKALRDLGVKGALGGHSN